MRSGRATLFHWLQVWCAYLTLTLIALPVFAEQPPANNQSPSLLVDARPKLAKQAFVDAANDLLAMAQIRLGLTRQWRKFQTFIGVDASEYKPDKPLLPDAPDESYWRDHLSWQPAYQRARSFLPSRDSLKIGVRFQDDVWHDRLGIEIRPYIGQAWTTTENIWGAEAILTLRDAERHDIARLAMRFDEGAPNFAVRSPGYDIYGQWRIRDDLTFNIGTRARADEAHSGYSIIRWRWVFK